MTFSSILAALASFQLCSGTLESNVNRNRSFLIDYDNNRFLLDGRPFRYISGSVHYFRIHPDLWDDRLKRIRAAGLNAIQFYIPWNFHEPFKGHYIFDGARDITRFVQLTAKNNLFILLRLGPYICSEWENGGLPWWLILDEDIKMRTADPRYTQEVKRWFDKLLPMFVPYLRKNGGPILMVQPENEYGSYYACDRNYTTWLSSLIRSHFGSDVVQYTTDGAGDSFLKCGVIPNVYPTVDFGPTTKEGVDFGFAAQRHFAPKGPLVNSEFYPGWLVLWGQKSQELPSVAQIVNTSAYMYELGASFNYYMIHGGTNFGFWNGAEVEAPVITSYDFTAPLNEAGDVTDKYIAIRNWIKSIPNWPTPPMDLPKNNKKKGYGRVEMQPIGALSNDRLRQIVTRNSECVRSKYPISFEKLNHPFGFVVYFTTLKFGGTNLSIPLLKDHGFTFLDGKLQGIFVDIFFKYSRRWITVQGAKPGKVLSILVENRGRQTYETINDFKGILSNVTLDGHIIVNWTQCGVHLKQLDRELKRPYSNRLREARAQAANAFHKLPEGPGVFFGSFSAKEAADTFFDPTGWGKGVLIVNGQNIGRYWPSVGPQVTLYVPKPYLKAKNLVILLELESAGNCGAKACFVRFIDHPIFNFTRTSVGINAMDGRHRGLQYNQH